jgi:hypothetical protein
MEEIKMKKKSKNFFKMPRGTDNATPYQFKCKFKKVENENMVGYSSIFIKILHILNKLDGVVDECDSQSIGVMDKDEFYKLIESRMVDAYKVNKISNSKNNDIFNIVEYSTIEHVCSFKSLIFSLKIKECSENIKINMSLTLGTRSNNLEQLRSAFINYKTLAEQFDLRLIRLKESIPRFDIMEFINHNECKKNEFTYKYNQQKDRYGSAYIGTFTISNNIQTLNISGMLRYMNHYDVDIQFNHDDIIKHEIYNTIDIVALAVDLSNMYGISMTRDIINSIPGIYSTVLIEPMMDIELYPDNHYFKIKPRSRYPYQNYQEY